VSIQQALKLADQIRPENFEQDLQKAAKWELAAALKTLAGAYRRTKTITLCPGLP